MRSVAAVVMAAACMGAVGARADVWDDGPANDDTSDGTVNELLHGSDQVHDLAGRDGNTIADVDWFRLQVPLNSSFEVLVDELAGGIGGPGAAPKLELAEVTSAGPSFILAAPKPVTGFGSARRIAWSHAEPVSAGEKAYLVRVSGAACGAACTTSSRYRIRMVDTTLRVARFNTTNGQSTVLVLQNPTNETQGLSIYAFGANGDQVGGFVTFLRPKEVAAMNLSTFGLANQAGGLQILNIAPYGALTGKTVQMDPATGFVFETAAGYRER
jgi:hypothetical protein